VYKEKRNNKASITYIYVYMKHNIITFN